MSGFIGDLNEEQEEGLRLFKERVEAPDDYTCARFLRARQFDVDKALEMYTAYVRYRKESGVERILQAELPKKATFDRLVPHAFQGFDRDGRPLYIEKIGSIDFPTFYKHFNDHDLMRHHIFQMETLLARCAEGTARVGHHVDSVSLVMDLANLNMGHRKALGFIRLSAAHDQAYYPERLGRIYLINAPWVFPWFWKVCKRWIDDRTRSKIVVLGKDFKEELAKYIEPEFLPEEYGGTGPNIDVSDVSDLRAGPNVDEDLEADDAQTVTIHARGVHEVTLELGEGGGTFEWAFKTLHKDIQFSVELLEGGEEGHGEQGDYEDHEHDEHANLEREIVAPERVHVGKDSHIVHVPTRILLRWDNSYSRFTSKQISFVARAVLPEVAVAQVDDEQAEDDSDDGKDDEEVSDNSVADGADNDDEEHI